MADKGFKTPFKDAIVPVPSPGGDWGGKIGGNNLPDAPGVTKDGTDAHDTISLDGQGAGKVDAPTYPGGGSK